METCGILLAFPVVAVASLAYAVLARYLLSRNAVLARLLVGISGGVLLLTATELIVVALKGIVGGRATIGPLFEVLHAVVFFLTPPAVANMFVLTGKRRCAALPIVAVVTFIVAISLVFWNIHVSETLYGVDGVGGPYGTRMKW
jgi:hypothetical protein